jgi:hypothetical protein
MIAEAEALVRHASTLGSIGLKRDPAVRRFLQQRQSALAFEPPRGEAGTATNQ